MSSVVYGALTARRQESPERQSTSTEPPGLKSYVDSLAALVPAEVLALHAAILAVTTTTTTNDEAATTVITNPGVVRWSFWGLVGMAMLLYLVGRSGLVGGTKSHLDRWDAVRVLIPALAFIGWSMIQKDTAFDALGLGWSLALREVLALFGAVLLGAVATLLAYKADAAQPSKPVTAQSDPPLLSPPVVRAPAYAAPPVPNPVEGSRADADYRLQTEGLANDLLEKREKYAYFLITAMTAVLVFTFHDFNSATGVLHAAPVALVASGWGVLILAGILPIYFIHMRQAAYTVNLRVLMGRRAATPDELLELAKARRLVEGGERLMALLFVVAVAVLASAYVVGFASSHG